MSCLAGGLGDDSNQQRLTDKVIQVFMKNRVRCSSGRKEELRLRCERGSVGIDSSNVDTSNKATAETLFFLRFGSPNVKWWL